MNTRLILREVNSPFPTPYTDLTKGSVLSRSELDNNLIYLKGETLYSAITSGSTISLLKLNGNSIDLSGVSSDTFVTGGTMSADTFLILTRNDDQNVIIDLGLGQPTYNQYVNVTASTPNNYVGISSPSITGYSTNVIYLVTFTSTNTNTGTSINIDSIGSVDLFVPREEGLVYPNASAITPNIMYFMTYNGTSMQLYDSDPTSSSIVYTNPTPVPQTIGGVLSGMTFNGASMQEMWDTLLYPYLNPTFSNFSILGQSTTLEVGATITSGAKTFVWGTTYSGNLVNNSIKIKNLNTNSIISTPSSGITNDGSEIINISSITRSTPGTQTWTIYGTTNKNVVISKNFTVSWLDRIYYGTSPLTGLTAANISGLTSTTLTSTALSTYNFSTGDYKYICIPTSFANPTLFRDASTNLTVAMAGPSDGYTILNNGYYVNQVVVTNAFGINVTYDVYRTKNILGGQLSIITS